VKGKTLTLLIAAVILFGFSFTFSSCKDCGKERTKPADGDNEVSMLGDDNKAPDDQTTQNPVVLGNSTSTSGLAPDTKGLTPIQILQALVKEAEMLANSTSTSDTPIQILQALVKAAAIFACVAHATQEEMYCFRDELGRDTEMSLELLLMEHVIGELEKLTKRAVVAQAEATLDENIIAHTKAIRLLLVKAVREKKAAMYWNADRQMRLKLCPVNSVEVAAEARAENNNANEEWENERDANSGASEIARDAFVKVAMAIDAKIEKLRVQEAFDY
jgi:uncharacterized membrane protein